MKESGLILVIAFPGHGWGFDMLGRERTATTTCLISSSGKSSVFRSSRLLGVIAIGCLGSKNDLHKMFLSVKRVAMVKKVISWGSFLLFLKYFKVKKFF